MGRIALNAVLFFGLIVTLVRAGGERTTEQVNNFDWIMMIAVGSLAASGLLLANVAVLDAAVAIAALFLLQGITTRLVLRSATVSRLIKADPTLLVHKGELLKGAMRKTRISRTEILSALRDGGIATIAGANWVILENDGTFSIIPKQDILLEDATTLQDVEQS